MCPSVYWLTCLFVHMCSLVDVCLSVHVFMCLLVDMFICSCLFEHVCLYTCVYIDTCLFVHMCLLIYMFICTHVIIDACLFVHICLLIYMFICTHVFIDIHVYVQCILWWLWYSVTFYLFINIQILLFSIGAKNLFVIFVSNLLYRYTWPNKSFQVTWILFLCRIQYICSEKDLTVGLRLCVPKKKNSYIQWYSTHQIMTWRWC